MLIKIGLFHLFRQVHINHSSTIITEDSIKLQIRFSFITVWEYRVIADTGDFHITHYNPNYDLQNVKIKERTRPVFFRICSFVWRSKPIIFVIVRN